MKSSPRTLELLAPARNVECGMEAIRHGADAVYIGAGRFGARAAAGNSLDDIRRLCSYAHRFLAKVYVTVNTLIYEDELTEAQQLLAELAEANVDALLVQDMATLQLRQEVLDRVGRAPALHASTQCDVRTAEKVAWLKSLGFKRVVLARELSLDDIRAIHEAEPDMELEVFVHGALCVSLSGLCYASEACLGRSANRGECAQMCRMKYDLVDADGKMIERQRHLLSLKDLCQIDHLEELAEAGACSFKIEGRLKGVDYVKNVVAAYSQRLNELVEKYPNRYVRASQGRVDCHFKPNLQKTFNRGFTTFFLHARQRDIASFDTPKALGEMVGRVKEMRPDSFTVASTASFANGDGLCFLNEQHELEGFRVNRAVGNRLIPFKMPRSLKPRMLLYRNNDEAFTRLLAGKTADRKLPLAIRFGTYTEGMETENGGAAQREEGFRMEISVLGQRGERLISACSRVPFAHQPAQKPQGENMRRQLTKLGNTDLECVDFCVEPRAEGLFVPSSILSELRHEAVEVLYKQLDQQAERTLQCADQGEKRTEGDAKAWQSGYENHSYTYNISNSLARQFYASHGIKRADDAFELRRPQGEKLLMQCRHCLRYSLGCCVRHGGRQPQWREPLSLRLGDGRKFTLRFNCKECQMEVLAE